MMQTLVDIGEDELKALDALAERQQVSRSSLIRKAVDDFLARQVQARQAAFGLWSEAPSDGLDYQNKIRAEW
jgi:predicted transcriptional regulator